MHTPSSFLDLLLILSVYPWPCFVKHVTLFCCMEDTLYCRITERNQICMLKMPEVISMCRAMHLRDCGNEHAYIKRTNSASFPHLQLEQDQTMSKGMIVNAQDFADSSAEDSEVQNLDKKFLELQVSIVCAILCF
jgi:hypothetical protein